MLLRRQRFCDLHFMGAHGIFLLAVGIIIIIIIKSERHDNIMV